MRTRTIPRSASYEPMDAQDENMEIYPDRLASVGSATHDKIIEGVQQEMNTMMQKELVLEREKVTQDMQSVLSCVPDLVRKALQPIEVHVSEMATVAGSFSKVTVMENNIDHNRKGVASFAS